MSDTTEPGIDVMVDPVTGEIIDEKKLAQQPLAQSKEQGVGLIGPGGLLSGLTKTVLETALDAELTEHVGHEHGETPLGSNMRDGGRAKTVLTEIGPVQIEVRWDRDGSFEPVIARKRRRRLDGIDEIVLSLASEASDGREIAAHADAAQPAARCCCTPMRNPSPRRPSVRRGSLVRVIAHRLPAACCGMSAPSRAGIAGAA